MTLACRTAGGMVSISDIALLKCSLNPCLIYTHTLVIDSVKSNGKYTFSLAIVVLYKRLPFFGIHHKLLCVVLEATIGLFGNSLIPEGDRL